MRRVDLLAAFLALLFIALLWLLWNRPLAATVVLTPTAKWVAPSWNASSLLDQRRPQEKCVQTGDLYGDVENSLRARQWWSMNLVAILESFHNHYQNYASIKGISNKVSENAVPYGSDRFELLGPLGPTCHSMEVYGKGDEGKKACGLKKLAENCVVFSIGSNNKWSFEESIVKNTNCFVHVFDCTLSSDVLPPPNIRSRVKLFHVCIGDADKVLDSRRFLTWESILQLSNQTQSPSYLKMDIEGWEYPVLKQIIDSGKHLPLQIAFELHFYTYAATKLSWTNRYKSPGEIALFMDFLYRFGNYHMVDRNDNTYCAHCTELLMARLCQ